MTPPQDERDKKRWGFLPNKLRIKMSAYNETNMHLYIYNKNVNIN